ncbi:hypothetical protein ACH5RR_018734 [Cinchona calisaya]|uniref:RING-type E3 ubiquitin transferase n=1 Tax=Cinchona calisaya TaxID=153742 RepID=A0ABD2ZQG4_9GENT
MAEEAESSSAVAVLPPKAKAEEAESSSAVAVLPPKAKAEEVKKELQSLIQRVLDADNPAFEDIDRSMHALRSLKDLTLVTLFPPEFICPLSGLVMIDPVVISSGQTFDRSSIQKWLKDDNRICPRTKEVLTNVILIPNVVIKKLISSWCKERGFMLPNSREDIDEEETIPNQNRGVLKSLLEKLCYSALSGRKMAAKDLKRKTKESIIDSAQFGEISHGICYIVEALSSRMADKDPQLKGDLIKIIFNLSQHDVNKRLLGEYPNVIPLLIQALSTRSIDIRMKAASTLILLSCLDSNSKKIRELGALKPLIELLDAGHPQAMKAAASAIFNLSIADENKHRVISDGAIGVIMKKLEPDFLWDVLFPILALLSTQQEVIDEMAKLGAVPFLLHIIKRRKTSADNKEKCIVMLHNICSNDRARLREIKREEVTYHTISQLSYIGTSKARRKANALLQLLDREILL